MTDPFWERHVVHRDDPEVIRAGGKHYRLGSEDERQAFRGYGGRYFAFRMLATGEVVRTTNLWHQGTVPVEYHDRLPDNAEQLPQCGHDFPDPPWLAEKLANGTAIRFGRSRCVLEAGHDWSDRHLSFVRPGLWRDRIVPTR